MTPLSRRNFFRKITRPGVRTPDERRERYQEMDEYLRATLMPAYDFPLTDEQRQQLRAHVRSDLETATDDELFSIVVLFRVEEAADRKIRVWRGEYRQ